MIAGLIELLESFNRKERFFLISQAVGEFQLNDDFRRELGKAINVDVPHDAFTAMDYHLEWLTAALYAYECGDEGRIFDNPLQQVIKEATGVGSRVAVGTRVGLSVTGATVCETGVEEGAEGLA